MFAFLCFLVTSSQIFGIVKSQDFRQSPHLQSSPNIMSEIASRLYPVSRFFVSGDSFDSNETITNRNVASRFFIDNGPNSQAYPRESTRMVILTKHVPFPVKVETEKKVPVYVNVPVEKPYTVVVPKPYFVPIEKHVPYPVEVTVPQPYPVEKVVPVPVKVAVQKETPYIVPKPYPVLKEKVVGVTVDNPISVPLKISYDRPVPVPINVPVEKKSPYPFEKRASYPAIFESHERPFAGHVDRPYPVQYDKPILQYAIEKMIPYLVPIPIKFPLFHQIYEDSTGSASSFPTFKREENLNFTTPAMSSISTITAKANDSILSIARETSTHRATNEKSGFRPIFYSEVNAHYENLESNDYDDVDTSSTNRTFSKS